MPRPNIIGSSTRLTNNTFVFGSLPGLAPTTGVRPNVTGLHGYKYYRLAANGVNWKTGASLSTNVAECGLNENVANSKVCIETLKKMGYIRTQNKTGAKYVGKKHLN